MIAKLTLIKQTLRALLRPRRGVPTVVVCGAMLYAQSRYGRPSTVLLGLGFCALFVGVAPVTWRLLFAEPLPPMRAALHLAIYAAIGAALTFGVGWGVPDLFHLYPSFLTRNTSLVVILALVWVGGWGLARDVGFEDQLAREAERANALAREAERAQLLALRAQLDPHFLFNTLNAIAEWCRQDGEVAERAVLQLSAMLREVLAGTQAAAWPLRRELELVQTLFTLHLLRDPALFTLELRVPPEALALEVPPMILLPLAENAVKHGPAAGHRGAIALTLSLDDTNVRLTLENPGPYKGPRPGSDGLPTLERRLALAYGGAATHRITGIDAPGARTRLELCFPREVSA